jgi:hypothetical protein
MTNGPNSDPSTGNLRMIGKILAISALVLAGFAVAALLGLLPLSKPASYAAAIVFGVTAGAELLTALFFLQRYKE